MYKIILFKWLMTKILLGIVSGFADSCTSFFFCPISRFSTVRLCYLPQFPITFIKYIFTYHFCHLHITKVKKKKVPITHINVRERSKYTRVTVTKFGRGFTLPTTYTVTKVDGHKAMISIQIRETGKGDGQWR